MAASTAINCIAQASQIVDVVASKTEDLNRALVKVKEGLHTVKVSQFDATQVQREMEGELFDKWHEGCEVFSLKIILI